jgi:GTP cyclohydrolase II
VALGYAADARTYAAAAQMLRALGVGEVDLLTNNPDKAAQLEAHGILVRQRVPTAVHVSHANARYLAAKARRGGHDLAYP